MVITFRQKQKKKNFAFFYGLQINKLSLTSRPRRVCLAELIKTIYKCLYAFCWWLSILYQARFFGIRVLWNCKTPITFELSIIKLLNNSSYFLHSYDGATTAATDDDTDNDDDDDTLSASKGVKSFSLRRLLSFSLPAVR
jgi:hypothetical protein